MFDWTIDRDIWKTLNFKQKCAAVYGCVLLNLGIIKAGD